MSNTETLYQNIQGGKELVDWFGIVPSFHDAEILSLHLDRSEGARLTLYGWITSDALDEQGYFVNNKRATVTFTFKEITDLKLDEFNQQNVINGLALSRHSEKNENGTELGEVQLTLNHCFGLSGYLRGRGLSVNFVPKETD
jgi:hypothetical protein